MSENKKFINHYRKEAKFYDNRRLACNHQKIYDLLIKEILLNFLTGKKHILECGCGTGRFSIYLAENGASLSAIDTSKEMLKIAKQKIINLNPTISKRITLVKGDMKNFNLEKKFSYIFIAFRSFQNLFSCCCHYKLPVQLHFLKLYSHFS